MRGVVWTLLQDRGELRLADLVEGRNTRAWKEEQRNKRLRTLAKEIGIGIACWAAWEGGKWALHLQ